MICQPPFSSRSLIINCLGLWLFAQPGGLLASSGRDDPILLSSYWVTNYVDHMRLNGSTVILFSYHGIELVDISEPQTPRLLSLV